MILMRVLEEEEEEEEALYFPPGDSPLCLIFMAFTSFIFLWLSPLSLSSSTSRE
jgi:hypothetical protein